MSQSNDYDELTEWRKTSCIINNFTTSSNENLRRNFLEPLIQNIKNIFGEKTQEQGGLTDNELWVLDNLVDLDDSKFLSLKYVFFFFHLVHFPPFLNYFRNGNENKSIHPPPLANNKKFDTFVSNHLPKLCEAFLSQTSENSEINFQDKPTYKAIQYFDREVRETFQKIVGIPIDGRVSEEIDLRRRKYDSKLSKK